MPRITNEEITRIKAEISMIRLSEAQGIELKKQSNEEYSGRCIFHDDKNPSYYVNIRKNQWYCHGCGIGGSNIDFVMKSQGVSYRHALELLRNDLFSSAAQDGPAKPIKRATIRKLPTFATDPDDQAALKRVNNYYHECLKCRPEALAYLEKRGLKNSEIIERFQLGYCDRSLPYRLPERNRKEGAQIREQLIRIGILRNTGHELFRGSITCPIIDENGVITEMYGRKINDNLRKGTAYHLYLPGSHKGVFNITALRCSDEIILCESIFDALSFFVAGFRNVTAAYGIDGFTDDYFAAFKQYGIKRVLIAYDRHAQGDDAAVELAGKLTTEAAYVH